MPVVALSQGLATETDAELERELLTLNAHMCAATHRFLMLVCTFDARTAEALAHGRISYAKLRALSRLATAENQGFFLDMAEYGTASHMEKIVRYIRSGMALDDAARLGAMVEQCACDWYHDDDGMLVLRARLMPDEGARRVKAIRRAMNARDQGCRFPSTVHSRRAAAAPAH